MTADCSWMPSGLIKSNYERIEEIADEKIVVYGSDFQGWHESLLITEYTGWSYFNTPNYLYKYDIEDPSDLVDQIGLEPLKQLLKNPNFTQLIISVPNTNSQITNGDPGIFIHEHINYFNKNSLTNILNFFNFELESYKEDKTDIYFTAVSSSTSQIW